MNTQSEISENDASHGGHPRTEAALKRLRLAMSTIEAEIDAHGGNYPYNHGRMSQSELCRRADVKKATLQNPVHRDSTRAEVMDWCEQVNARLMLAKDAARLDTGAEPASTGENALRQERDELKRQLDAAMQQIAELKQEAAGLRERLGVN